VLAPDKNSGSRIPLGSLLSTLVRAKLQTVP
jgi:hypothetical protein